MIAISLKLPLKTSILEKFSKKYQNLEKKGQKPKAMIISCCDSRVDANQIFAANPGDFFIHRNVANLIPDLNIKNTNHEITTSIDYALSLIHI